MATKRPSTSSEERHSSKRRRTSEKSAASNGTPLSKILLSNNDANNAAGGNGIIEAVYLKDFMCHSRLEFSFGENVNFITGRNGSGKSAILTAVVVALGGKANVTSRGNSLKSFVKNGKRDTKVQVKLRNLGSEAYHPDLYGSTIVVERRISIEGSGTYRIMASDGKLISNKKEELANILEHFNIQVDNPMSILNQEVSRNFLNSKSPRDKYIFFLKATQLEQLKNDYTLAEEQKQSAKSMLKGKKEMLPLLEQEVKEWHRKREFLDSLVKMQEKVVRLKNELVWVHISVEEDCVAEKATQLEKEKKKLDVLKKKVEEYQPKIKQIMTKRSEAQKEAETMAEKIQELQPKYRQTEFELTGLKMRFRDQQLEKRKLENTIQVSEKDEKSLMLRIEQLRSEGQQDYTKEREERLRKIEELQKQMQNALAREKNTKVHRDQLEASIERITEERESLRREEMDKKDYVQSLNRQIRNLEASKTDQLKKFGGYVPELRKAIERAYQQKKFIKKPRGPIGAYIKLKDQKWALGVEACIRGLLTTFCCDNHRDQQQLESLMHDIIRDGHKPSIIVSKFSNEVYDVRKYAVQSQNYPSVLQMLEIDDPVITNCLIDQRGIESVLLIAENREARHVMLNAVPRNCNEAFTLCGDQIYAAPNFRYYSSTKRTADLLQADVDGKIQQLRTELSDAEQQHSEIHEKVLCSQSFLHQNRQELKSVNANMAKISQECQNLNAQIIELKNFEEPVPIDMTVLEEELSSLQSKRQATMEKHREIQHTLDETRKLVLQKEKEHSELLKFKNSLSSDSESLKEKLVQVESQLQELQERKRCHEARYKDFLAKVKEQEEKYKQDLATLEEKKSQAERICERISSRRTISDLESQILQMEERLTQEETRQENRTEILEKCVEVKQRYNQCMKEVKMLEDFLEMLSKAMEERTKAYVTLRQQLSLRIKVLFITALKQRHFMGKLIFDHEKETLDIIAKPDENAKEFIKDTKSLSGGERSFATVSLILALWNATESPFHILDEFDVYMDMVTRRMSMNMMLTTALQKTKSQFVFLTPLEMSSLPDDRRIKICRMPDPDRTQSTLSFSSQDESEQ